MLQKRTMTKAEKAVVILLRIFGVSALFAIVPVVMPLSWMVGTHRLLGLGEMPTAPVVEYLARSLSAFYVLFGAICLMLAADLNRYRPVVQFLGAALVPIGAILTVVDLALGMPWWWSACEGPPTVLVGLLLCFLARQNRGEAGNAYVFQTSTRR
jgi:hypothetical protein